VSATHNRTFDCPWCGAISPVPSDHLGEHFMCGECKKATKLTDKNTSSRKPTDAPPDAPHLSGDRTFDCPWCGAISSLDSSHLGERFHCTECNKETRLTATNTRRAPITAPPPDAPPPAPTSSGKGVMVALVLAAAGIGAWWFLRDEGTSPTAKEPSGATEIGRAPGAPTPTGPDAAMTPATPEPPEPPETPEGAMAPDATLPAPVPPGTPAGPTPSPMPSDEGMGVVGPPAPPAPPSALEEAQAVLAAATSRRAAALEKEYAARASLDDWKRENPAAAVAAEHMPGLLEIAAEAKRVADEKQVIPEPEKATPEQVRAYDAALVAYTAASPARTKAAEQVLAWLRADPFGREGHGIADWKGLHFAGDGVKRAFVALEQVWGPGAAMWPVDLANALQTATAEGEAAQKAVLDAEARLAAAKGAK